MKRVLVVTFIVAFAVVLGAIPYWFGVEAERIYQQQISALESGNKVEILKNHFERGWLTSHAESEMAISRTPLIVLVEHTIEHGPIPTSDPLRYITSMRPLQALIKSRLAVQKSDQPEHNPAGGTLLTRVEIDGTSRTVVDVPAQGVQLNPSASVAWEQVSGHVDFDPATGSWQGTLNLSAANWAEHDASISV